ncbi:MAG: CHAT domain-containing protein [Solirubrobacteraceae bacterium]
MKKFYLAPDIDERKLAKARASAAVPDTEEVVALIDCTVFRSAKDALIFGKERIYHHTLGDPPRAWRYPDFVRHLVALKGLSLEFDDGTKVSLAGTSAPSAKVEAILAAVKETVRDCADQQLFDTVVEQLDRAISREDGVRFLNSQGEALTEQDADAIGARAKELAAAMDPRGAQEFQYWARVARTIVILRALLESDANSRDELRELFEAQRERFDDAFVEYCCNTALVCIRRLHAVGSEVSTAEALPQEVVDAMENAQMWVNLTVTVARIAGRALCLAQATAVQGGLALTLLDLEERAGNDEAAVASRAQAQEALTSCASDGSAPAGLRAKAEMGLAGLAGEDYPDQVRKHEAAAQRWAEAAGDTAILARIRSDRAYGNEEAADWSAAYDLYKANIDGVEEALLETWSPSRAAELVAGAKQDYKGIVAVCLERAKADPSFYERALEFADMGKARAFLRSLATFATPGPTPVRLLKRREFILDQMRSLGPKLAELPADIVMRHRADANRLTSALASVEEEIEAYATARGTDLSCVPSTFDEMVAAVPDHGVVLSYFVVEDRLVLFVLEKGGLAGPPIEISTDGDDLGRVLVNVMLTISFRGEPGKLDEAQRELDMKIDDVDPSQNLRFLYSKLIQPAENWLREKQQVYIVPPAGLCGFPFHAMLNQAGDPVIDVAPIAYAPSLAVLRHCLKAQRSPGSQCFAGGVKHQGPKSAVDEAQTVAKIYGTTDRPADRASVIAGAGESDLLHLACHSDFGHGYTSFDGLLLEDGPLLPSEISALQCKASLVTLSACQSALADMMPGAELSGLVGAFFRAGCPSVVASLWPLADRVALPMMRPFYHSLRRGDSCAAALRNAQREVRADPQFTHPYFWAPFCLWGVA